MKELTLLREGPHEMRQCYKRQHFAAYHHLHELPRRHSSWRESTKMKFMNIQMECSKKTRIFLILIHLECYFGRHDKEVGDRNWMDPDMHTVLLDTKLLKATLLNMYNPTLMETILKKLREQSAMDDQMKSAGEIVGSVPETSLDWDPILTEQRRFLE